MPMGLNPTPTMFIPMRLKAFVCNILRRFKARARGPRGCKIYCFNQYGRRVNKANRQLEIEKNILIKKIINNYNNTHLKYIFKGYLLS